jgi:uncharacterized membrane protein
VTVPRWAPWSSFALCLLGLADSVYLTLEHYSSKVTLACSDSGAINCAKVTTSKYSEVAGIPVALLGLIFFVVMTGLCLPAVWRLPRLVPVRVVGAGVGMLSVFYLVWAELEVGAICLYCTGVHVITFLLLGVVTLAAAFTGPAIEPANA